MEITAALRCAPAAPQNSTAAFRSSLKPVELSMLSPVRMDMSITSLIERGKDMRGNGSVFDLRQRLRPQLAQNAGVSHAEDRLRKIKAAVCGSCQTSDSYR